jgi:DNA-directed RNA polymerase alpha subunit
MKHFGIKTISDLRKISLDELNNLDQAGVKTVNEIVNRAAEFGVIIK